MPPKKKAATVGADETGGSFRWTLENERKLLILVQGRYLTAEDYDRLLTVFPGTNLNGVKIKVSRFRVEQRTLYDQLGWQLPEGGAVSKRKKPAQGEDDAESEAPAKRPAKKPRATKAKKEEIVAEDEDDVGVGVGFGGAVKEEQIEDEA